MADETNESVPAVTTVRIDGLFWEPVLSQEGDLVVLHFEWMQDQATAVQTITKTGVDTTNTTLTFLNKSYNAQLKSYTPKEHCLVHSDPSTSSQIDYNPNEFDFGTPYPVSFTFTVAGFMATAHYLQQMRAYSCTGLTEPLAWNEQATIELYTETSTQLVLMGPVAHVLASKCKHFLEQLLRS
jgi:hypothetical protein